VKSTNILGLPVRIEQAGHISMARADTRSKSSAKTSSPTIFHVALTDLRAATASEHLRKTSMSHDT